jgi:membrane protein DedA with SNARE-associated domain
MTYSKFITYNVVGGITWIGLFVFGGYFIGGFPIIKDNFSIVTVLIILISVLPIAIEFVRSRRAPAAKGQAYASRGTTFQISGGATSMAYLRVVMSAL